MRILVFSILFFCIHFNAFAQSNKCSDLFNLDNLELESLPRTRSSFPDNPNGLVGRLIDVISEAGLSQADLGRMLQLSNAKISKVIRSNQLLRLHDVIIIAHTTGVKTWWLLTGEGNRYVTEPIAWFPSEYPKEILVREWRVSFGVLLKLAMNSVGVSGVQLAQNLQYDKAKISKVLQGEQELMPEAAVMAIRFLKVDPASILDDSLQISREVEVKERERVPDVILSDIDSRVLIMELISRGWGYYQSPNIASDAPGIIINLSTK